MLFHACMTGFLQWNTQKNIFKNNSVVFVHTVRVTPLIVIVFIVFFKIFSIVFMMVSI